jgi:hypothetical protein
MERLKRVDGLNRSQTYKAELEEAEVVDDQTLRVKLNQTDWRFFFKSLTFRFDLGDYTAMYCPSISTKISPMANSSTSKTLIFPRAGLSQPALTAFRSRPTSSLTTISVPPGGPSRPVSFLRNPMSGA